MGGPAGFDIRIPIGALFTACGTLLAAYGAMTASDRALYARALAIDIDLWWGLAMLAFGITMLSLGYRATRSHHTQGAHPTTGSPDGRATEAREHSSGLEHEDP
jgi:hypothetical protein